MSRELKLHQCTCSADLQNLSAVELVRQGNKPATSLEVVSARLRLEELIGARDVTAADPLHRGDPKSEAQELVESDAALDMADVPTMRDGQMLTIPQRIEILASWV